MLATREPSRDIMRDAPIIGSTSSNVTKFRMLLYAVILCVWSVRGCHSLLSFLEVDPSFTRVSKLSTHDTRTGHTKSHEENKNSDGAPGARWSCWWRAQRGAGQPSHVASLHPRPGVYTCTALRELSSISWCRLRGRPACAPSSLSLFVSAPARYSSNKRRSTLSRAASAGRTCERSKQATRSRSRGEPGCWRTSSSSACSEGGAAGQRA